jgi:hypothetical protein
MAALSPLTVTVTVKTRGLWKVALLGWLSRLWGIQPLVTVWLRHDL